jgi:predicted DNA-binding WGR domain protein
MTPLHQRWEKATRYYQVDICQDLWGQWVLIQRWGRRGTALGQTRRIPCAAYADALSPCWRASSGDDTSAAIALSVDLF